MLAVKAQQHTQQYCYSSHRRHSLITSSFLPRHLCYTRHSQAPILTTDKTSTMPRAVATPRAKLNEVTAECKRELLRCRRLITEQKYSQAYSLAQRVLIKAEEYELRDLSGHAHEIKKECTQLAEEADAAKAAGGVLPRPAPGAKNPRK